MRCRPFLILNHRTFPLQHDLIMWGGAFVMVPVRVSRGTNEMMQSLSNATCTPSLWCRPRVLCVCVSARRQWLGFMIALRGVVRCGETPPHQKRHHMRNAFSLRDASSPWPSATARPGKLAHLCTAVSLVRSLPSSAPSVSHPQPPAVSPAA